MHNVLPEEDKSQGKISMFTYIKYYKTGGGILLCTLLILVYLITEVCACICSTVHKYILVHVIE